MAFRPERLLLTPSTYLRWLVISVHAAAAAAPFLSSLSPWLAAPLSVTVLVHGVWCYRREVSLRASDAVVEVRWTEKSWLMRLNNGQEITVEPTGHTVLISHLSLLHLKPKAGGRARRVAVLPDSGDPEAIRRMRVQLRFGVAATVTPSSHY